MENLGEWLPGSTCRTSEADNAPNQPLLRRLVTRLIGVIPAAIVAAAAGNTGLNTMLVASQVLLSIVLPTVIFPLVYLCSKEDNMTVEGPEVDAHPNVIASTPVCTAQDTIPLPAPASGETPAASTRQRQTKSHRSPKLITVLGYVLFTIVVVANVYVIVELGLGQD